MQHVIDLGLQLSHHDLLVSQRLCQKFCVKNLVKKSCVRVSQQSAEHSTRDTSSNQDNDVMNYICYFFYFKCYFCSILFSYFYCQAV